MGETRDHQLAPRILIRLRLISAFMDQHDQWLIECQKLGFEPSPRRYSQGTVTSEDAAAQIGCDVAQIAKSIVFEGQSCAIVVIASGANKVDRKKKLRAILGYKPKVATPEYVLRETGFAPGGVPPPSDTREGQRYSWIGTYLDSRWYGEQLARRRLFSRFHLTYWQVSRVLASPT